MKPHADCVVDSRVTRTILGTAEWANANLDGDWYDCGPEVARDWLLIDGKFRIYPPYPSWTWDGTEYQPPVPEPEPVDGFTWGWDETAGEWVQIPKDKPQSDLTASKET